MILPRSMVILALPCLGWAQTRPGAVDNSSRPFFPPIIQQRNETCAQDVGLYSMLSYEWNRTEERAASDPSRQLAGGFAWNLLTGGINRGTELVEGWQLAKEMGVPSIAEYHSPDRPILLNGYDRWFRAMQRRVDRYELFPLETESDLDRARAWLWNHDEPGASSGGLWALEARHEGREQIKIPEGLPGAGRALITGWGHSGKGHLMTVVGYDDQIGHDLNGDGQLTNDRDITGDRKVTLADWERGAFLLANSHGESWGDKGRAYVLYRAAAASTFRRGRWLGRVYWRENYRPQVTMRLRLFCSDASAFHLKVLGSNQGNASAFEPLLFSERRWPVEPPNSPARYSRFSREGLRLGTWPIGKPTEPIEIGLDLSEALPKGCDRAELRASLAGGKAVAKVHSASVLQYAEDGNLQGELALKPLPGEPLRWGSEEPRP